MESLTPPRYSRRFLWSNQFITINKYHTCIKQVVEIFLGLNKSGQFDHIHQMTSLSGFMTVDIIKVDLFKVDLIKVDLIKIDLINVDLINVDLIKVDLIKVDLIDVDLIKVDIA